MTDLIGQRLGNYRLTHLIGRGGCAAVYLGEHIHLRTIAAIKVLQIQLANNDQTSFIEEARKLASLEHPGIVRLLDCGIERDIPFLVMVYASNGTLRELHPRGSIVPIVDVVSHITQLASALQYAHNRNLIHRDVKPENMLLGQYNEVMLSDFGIALLSSTSSSMSTKAVAGTWAYMAPEQVMGKPKRASDQYALGVVAYEWLCGERPFQGTFSELCAQHLYASVPPLRTRNPQIPQEMERAILTALAKDAQDRFATVQTFARALAQSSSHPRPYNVPNVAPSTKQDTQWHIPTFLGSFDQKNHVKQQYVANLLKYPVTPPPVTPSPITPPPITLSPMTPPPMTNYQYQPDSTPGVPSHQQSAFVSVTPPPVLPIRKRAPRWPIVLLICLTAIITTYMASGSGGWMPHLSTKNVFVHQATSANIDSNTELEPWRWRRNVQ